VRVAAPWVFDARLGTTCQPDVVDDSAACLPPRLSTTPVSLSPDPSCATYVTTAQFTGCTPPTYYQYPFNGKAELRIHELVEPGVLFGSIDGECRPVDTARVRVIGRKMELGEFVPAVRE
jgi:hypothetical protein